MKFLHNSQVDQDWYWWQISSQGSAILSQFSCFHWRFCWDHCFVEEATWKYSCWISIVVHSSFSYLNFQDFIPLLTKLNWLRKTFISQWKVKVFIDETFAGSSWRSSSEVPWIPIDFPRNVCLQDGVPGRIFFKVIQLLNVEPK